MNDKENNHERKLAGVIYFLYLTAFFTFGLGIIVGSLLAFFKKDKCVYDAYTSHFNYQLKILKWTLLACIFVLASGFIAGHVIAYFGREEPSYYFTIVAFIGFYPPLIIYVGMNLIGVYELVIDRKVGR